MTVIAEFRRHQKRRYQVQYRDGSVNWNTPTGPGFRTRLFALVDALAWRSCGYESRVLDTQAPSDAGGES